jgi:hypothetical protein
MTRRQGYIAFTTVSFIVVMYFVGKVLSWGLEKWDWWFWGAWMASFLIIAALMDAAERRNRRRDRIDSEDLE